MRTGDIALSVAMIALGVAVVALLNATDAELHPMIVETSASGAWDFNSAADDRQAPMPFTPCTLDPARNFLRWQERKA